MTSEKTTSSLEHCIHDLHDELFYQRYALDQHAIVSTADLQGRIISVNDNFCRISGYSRDELMGNDHAIVRSGLHPKGFFQAMYVRLARGEIWQGEICNRAKDGNLYWVSATMLMYCDANGLPSQYLSIRTDITQRKAYEQTLQNNLVQLEALVQSKTAALQEAVAVANAANLAKSEFLAHMSHEVRTPMNGVIGMVDVLQRTELNPDQQRMVATIANSSQALLHILKDILDFSKIEAGKLEVQHIATPLKEVADSVVQLMLGAASAKGVLLWLSVGPDVPTAIYADPARLRQVLLNLMSNAIKFTRLAPGETGEVTLALECGALADGKPAVLLHVRDSGIGMSQAVMARLFLPYAQGETDTSREFGGTGLGLSISQKLVALMGGQITVHSTPGKGSEFTVALPLHAAMAEPGTLSTLATPLAHGTAAHRLGHSAASEGVILVAEDDAVNRDVIREQLSLLGYAAEMAEDGRQALQKWQTGRYALLLTDCHMPHMDGFALTAAIRAASALGAVRPIIIAITANAMRGEAQRCLDGGMDDFMTKPVRLKDLGDMLAKWLPARVLTDI
jgi:PAS domain S-box-containing protein